MNKFNEFDLIKTPRNWIDEVTATNFEPTKRAKVIRIKYIFAIFLIVMTIEFLHWELLMHFLIHFVLG